MKAALVRKPGAGFVTEEVQLDEPSGWEVVVDVKASGLCHTDHGIAQYGGGFPFPVVLGHEVSGVVSRIGSQVTALAPGDHVVACLSQYCGKCRTCLTGRTFQCEHPEFTLRTADLPPRVSVGDTPVFPLFGIGGFAQQVLVHENQLVKVDEKVPFPQAALLGCGVITGAGAVINSANTQPGDGVVVIGVGGVGLNAVSGAVLAGATTIIAVDIADDKLAKAKQFGATHTINSKNIDAVVEVHAITGRGADSAFDFVGTPEVTRAGMEMLRVGGGLYLIGCLDPTAVFEVSNFQLLTTQKHIHGVYLGSSTAKRDIQLFADLYLQGKFELDALVSRTIDLESIDKGYDLLKEPDVTRVVITSGLS